MIVAAYLGIGFIVLIVAFLIRGPEQMWSDLTSDDGDLDWLFVFLTLFFWPIILALVAVSGFVLGAARLAKWLTEHFVRMCKGGEK